MKKPTRTPSASDHFTYTFSEFQTINNDYGSSIILMLRKMKMIEIEIMSKKLVLYKNIIHVKKRV